jgi:hypothetical protein
MTGNRAFIVHRLCRVRRHAGKRQVDHRGRPPRHPEPRGRKHLPAPDPHLHAPEQAELAGIHEEAAALCNLQLKEHLDQVEVRGSTAWRRLPQRRLWGRLCG